MDNLFSISLDNPYDSFESLYLIGDDGELWNWLMDDSPIEGKDDDDEILIPVPNDSYCFVGGVMYSVSSPKALSSKTTDTLSTSAYFFGSAKAHSLVGVLKDVGSVYKYEIPDERRISYLLMFPDQYS